MTAPIVLREALTEADWEAVQAVRTRVFIDEQGVMPDDEWDIADAPSARGLSTHHVLAVRDGTPVGVARWRAVGDALWNTTTPFDDVVDYFPCPLLALRTLISDPIVGLPPGMAGALDDVDSEWRVNGRRGVGQLSV